MSIESWAGASLQAGGLAAVAGEAVTHPMDTVITRMQSAEYRTRYRHADGSARRALAAGLYQGFGASLAASVPSSAVFFLGYEAARAACARARADGHLAAVPQPLLDAASSAAAELVACAVANPAEVLKQHAQVAPPGQTTAATLRRMWRRPWAGYWALVASQLPGVSLTFALYEAVKAPLLARRGGDDVARRLEASALSAALAGGCSAWVFVPVDVVKTRLRLADPAAPPRAALGVARDVLAAEGVAGLFRGAALTSVAAAVGSLVYIGCYESAKVLLGES